MKRINLFLFILLLTACDKTYLDNHPQDFEHGRLLIEFRDSVKLQDAAGICFKLNTPLIWAKGFSFISSLPSDSANMIRSILLSRQYIDPSSLNSALIISDPAKIFLNGLQFNNITGNDTSDLSATENELRMSEYFYPGGSYPYCRSVLVQVPESTEAVFAYQFNEYKQVKTIKLYRPDMDKKSP